MNESIMIQALAATWVTLGLAKAAGITPENIHARRRSSGVPTSSSTHFGAA
jgi:hypothetical protein